jgi:spore germination protein YaaH
MKKLIASLLILCVCVGVYMPNTLDAADLSDGNERVRLFYYRHSDRAYASLKKNYKSIDVIAPQVHTIDAAGTLVGEIPKKVLTLAKRRDINVIPLVTNGAFDRASAHALLDDVDAQDKAVTAMVKEAKMLKYAGWQIDFEQMSDTYKDKFSAFIKRAGDAFEKEDLSLSVAVIAKVSENPDDYPNDLWKKLMGVYDFEALAVSADFISLMSYDEPFKTGPVSPKPWLERVVVHALTKIPAEKLSIGIPLYYWEREDATNRIMEIGGSNGVKIAKKARGSKEGFDAAMGTAFITYVVDGTQRTLWYENPKSISTKLDLIDSYDAHGFSAWALGLETPETHRSFVKWGN